MRARGCHALPRPTVRDCGWVCTGQGLTVLLTGPGLVPCVLPTAMVPDALRAEWGRAYDPPIPFAGGDHYHLVAPDVWLHA